MAAATATPGNPTQAGGLKSQPVSVAAGFGASAPDGGSHTGAGAQTGAGSHAGAGSHGSASFGAHDSATNGPGAVPGAPTSGTAGAAQATLVAAPGGPLSALDSRVQAPRLPEGLVRTSVSLQEAVDAVRASFVAANQAGVSAARISLSPESLGGITISLSQTREGLIARVAAEHPEAAQTLQQNAGELKRSLEATGMPLLRLDIGSSGQQGLGGFTGSQPEGSGTSASSPPPRLDAAGADDPSTPTELTVKLASGSLVNVLA